MNKSLLLITALSLCVSVITCVSNGNRYEQQQQSTPSQQSIALQESTPSTIKATSIQEGATTPIPPDYFGEVDEQGEIVRVDYATFNYAGSRESITKPAYIYLPHGYDENDPKMKYDIIYLMHGWGGTAENFFRVQSSSLKNLLDNMISHRKINPTIVVTPTFDPLNKPNDFSTSVKEIAVFHNDLVNELIPAIEGTFHTYAKSTDAKGLKESREHRAFGGFSLGAVTTWYSFVFNLDVFKYYLPMSGDCWILGQYGGLYQPEETAAYLSDIVKKSGYGEKDFFIYAATGSDDAVFDQVDNQMQAMLHWKDTFTENNLFYKIKPGGVHNFSAVMEYVYNALPLFF